MLRVDGISVRFGGVQALTEVSLEAEKASVTGLIGPNGAGKTTLFNVITGLQRPASGRVFLEGTDVTAVGPQARARLGMARTFQRLELFGSLTARENVQVALDARRSRLPRRLRAVEAARLLDQVGLADMADVPADFLPTGLARLLEIARALACQPRVLLLDEVSSGLDGAASSRLGDLLLRLASDGMALLLVEHDVDLVMNVCSSIYTLDFGRLIASGDPQTIQQSVVVQAAYLGVTS